MIQAKLKDRLPKSLRQYRRRAGGQGWFCSRAFLKWDLHTIMWILLLKTSNVVSKAVTSLNTHLSNEYHRRIKNIPHLIERIPCKYMFYWKGFIHLFTTSLPIGPKAVYIALLSHTITLWNSFESVWLSKVNQQVDLVSQTLVRQSNHYATLETSSWHLNK